EVTRGVAAAATTLSAYQARFAVTEYHFAPDVPVREFSMNVWFQAPERFRLDVVDHTQYPNRDVTPTDLELIVNGSSWYSVGPSACPIDVCPPSETVVENRVPFSSTTPAPTDLILPVTSLADANQLQVVGRVSVLGRPATATFRIPHTTGARDQGAKPVSISQASKETGFQTVEPKDVDGLGLYQVVLPPTPTSKGEPQQTLITYSKGLAWLKLGETRAWASDTLYGPVGLQAQEVTLAAGS